MSATPGSGSTPRTRKEPRPPRVALPIIPAARRDSGLTHPGSSGSSFRRQDTQLRLSRCHGPGPPAPPLLPPARHPQATSAA